MSETPLDLKNDRWTTEDFDGYYSVRGNVTSALLGKPGSRVGAGETARVGVKRHVAPTGVAGSADSDICVGAGSGRCNRL